MKTEFLMLCPKCKSKLENNYQEWRQKIENKGKNFQVYLKEICISSEELEEQQRHERLSALYSPKKNKVRKYVNLAFGAIVILAATLLAIRLGRLTGEGWMRNALMGINVGIAAASFIANAIYTLRRKKFQNFFPIWLGLAVTSLILLVDMVFFILTDNL
ncbi:MAG: hypothetical protein MJZ23_01400 [Paludibacteraceae bacterium]|nr:hypothetical protein [Paludibacteraceae bacterium]